MVQFLENPIYNESNNISSAMCARYLLSNAYVFEADLIIRSGSLNGTITHLTSWQPIRNGVMTGVLRRKTVSSLRRSWATTMPGETVAYPTGARWMGRSWQSAKVRIRGSWREGAFLGASAVGCVQKFISSGDTGVFLNGILSR